MNYLKQFSFSIFGILFFCIIALQLNSKTFSSRIYSDNYSSIKIKGPGIVSCYPSIETYSINIDNPLHQSHIWEWKVSGGTFENHKTEWVTETAMPSEIKINWSNSNFGFGQISLRIKKRTEDSGNKGQLTVLATTSKVIRIGLPNKVNIKLEEKIVLCSGNWYLLESSTLSKNEKVEWFIQNGVDIDGNSITYYEANGEQGKRLFLKPFNTEKPVVIDIAINNDCQNNSAPYLKGRKKFQSFSPLMGGPKYVGKGQSNEYAICGIPGDREVDWSSSGTIYKNKDHRVTILFHKAGEGFIKFTYDDCEGNEKNIVLQVKVIDGPANINTFVSGDPEILFNVFPNPVERESFKVELYQPFEGKVTVELMSLDGKRIISKKFKNNSTIIKTGDIPAGLYLLKVNTGSKESVSKIFIK